jgi:hypothetical protein
MSIFNEPNGPDVVRCRNLDWERRTRGEEVPPIRLADLAPRWLAAAEGRRGMGISFLCPCCRSRRLAFWFENPTDGGPPNRGQEVLWERVGEDFDRLSLPRCAYPDTREWMGVGARVRGHWHGWIKDGEVKTGYL